MQDTNLAARGVDCMHVTLIKMCVWGGGGCIPSATRTVMHCASAAARSFRELSNSVVSSSFLLLVIQHPDKKKNKMFIGWDIAVTSLSNQQSGMCCTLMIHAHPPPTIVHVSMAGAGRGVANANSFATSTLYTFHLRGNTGFKRV
jgi:hypothetical protein